jgi:hypothetical protein
VALISQRGNRTKACALRSARDSVDYFALDQAAQKRNVLRRVEQVDEPAAAIVDSATSKITVQGERYPEKLQRMTSL